LNKFRKVPKTAISAMIFGLFHQSGALAQQVPDTDDEKANIENITILGTKPERYQAVDASSATAFNAALKDIPRSIQVVTEQIILDQQALDIEDVMKNVSGVQTISNFGNTTDSFMIRGFNVRTIFQDGFRLSNNITRVQTTNIERVEILKGASALLYGQVQPGGLINIVTKKPQEETRNFISISFDEDGQQYLLTDFTGALSNDVLYRFVGSFEDTETFREAGSESEIERVNISPSITWFMSDKDTLTAGIEYIDAELPVDRGTVLTIDANGERSIADIPRSRRLGEDEDVSDTSQFIVRLDYEHRFSDDLKLQGQVRYQDGEADTRDSSITAFGINAFTLNAAPPLPVVSNILATALAGFDPGLNFGGVPIDPVTGQANMVRTGFRVESEEENLFTSLRLSGESGMHQFAVGVDYNSRESDFENGFNTITLAESGLPLPIPPNTLFLNFSAIDINNPVYGNVSTNITPSLRLNRDDSQLGIYAQDLISITDEWKALVGVRFDRFDREETQTQLLMNFPDPSLALVARLPTNIETVNDPGSDNEVSPNVGVVYQPSEDVSFYASYSESFTPNYVSNSQTGALISVDPREGEQVEFGVKGSLFDGALNVSAAYFQLELSNAVNGFNAETGDPIINGKEESDGFELDATVQFADGLNMIFNFAHIDAEITESLSNQGNTPLGVPDNSGNLWLTYEFTGGDWQGLGFGGGLSYTGSRFIDAANSFELDSYTVADITAWYYFDLGQGDQIRAQLGVKNLTDKEYYQAAQGTAFDINVGQPRTVYASLAYEF